jgi:hypothetical protein
MLVTIGLQLVACSFVVGVQEQEIEFENNRIHHSSCCLLRQPISLSQSPDHLYKVDFLLLDAYA